MTTKVFDLWLFTTKSGWMYMLDNQDFRPGDTVTDGEQTYEISKTFEVFPYPYATHGLVAFFGGADSWVYSFDKCIPNCKGKILQKVKNCGVAKLADAPACLAGADKETGSV